MKENNLLLEINNYRRLMGIPLISVKKHINEENENVANTVDDVTEEEITKLINKTGKTLEEIINSPILTETELGILFKIAKLKNLEPYTEEISLKTKNWDKDRIADIDFVLNKASFYTT